MSGPATFFRPIGASFGVAVFGALFTGRLGSELRSALHGEQLPPPSSPGALQRDPTSVRRLPAEVRDGVLGAYSNSITEVFLHGAPVALPAFVLAWFLKERPLRGSVRAPDAGVTVSTNPVERSSADEPSRALSLLSTRAGQRDLYAGIAERSGDGLAPAAFGMLLRIGRHGRVEPALLADRSWVPRSTVLSGVRQLEERGLAEREGPALVMTPDGERAAGRGGSGTRELPGRAAG